MIRRALATAATLSRPFRQGEELANSPKKRHYPPLSATARSSRKSRQTHGTPAFVAMGYGSGRDGAVFLGPVRKK